MTQNSVPQLRVLDLTDDLGAHAIRLLVGAGADVLRLRPDTDPAGCMVADLHWYAGTRVMRCPPAELDRRITDLLAGADVVIESGPLERLHTIDLREADPRSWSHLVHVVLTPFGMTGPRKEWLADDHVAAAAGGMTWLGGKPDEPPSPPPHHQATHLAGTHAAISALLGALARAGTGTGQLVEVSAQEAVAATLETGAIAWIHAGVIPARTGGVYGHVAHRVFPTADGFVAGGYSGPDRMWADLLSWMAQTGEAGDLTDPVWADPVHRWQHRPHVDAIVTAWTMRRTTAQIAEEARRRSLPWAEVAAPDDLLDNPQLREREYFISFDTPSGLVRDVGQPYESPALPRPLQMSAPREVDAGVGWSGRSLEERPRWQSRASEAGALAGLRVLDLTWVLAGPYMTKILAEHGADVIKIESVHRQDPTRFAPSMRLRPDAGPEESAYFLNFNRNKRSLALNLRSEEGPALLRRLAAEVDVVVENFSPGTLAKWGLGPRDMAELNPSAVLVSMAGVGATGPWHSAVTFADTLAAWSGLTHATAGADGVPQGFTFGLGDMVAANAAVLALLERLLRGDGGHVDLSQLEAMAAHLGPAVLRAQIPAAAHDADGPFILRAPGEDRWLAVGAGNLKRLAGMAAGRDPVRWLEEFAAGTPADAAATALQAHRIAAYPVRDGRDLVERDSQLAARNFYRTQVHPLVGEIRVEGPVHHLSATPPRLSRPAPLLGQHTNELLTELLDMTPAQIARLREEGVLE